MGIFKTLYEGLKDHSNVYQIRPFLEKGIPSGMFEGDYDLRELNGTNGGYVEYQIYEGGYTITFYHAVHFGRSVLFLYPGDRIANMMMIIHNNMDIWNRPSIERQWPFYYQAYENGKQARRNKISVSKFSHFDDSSYKFWTIAIEFDREITNFTIDRYHDIITKLLESASNITNEIAEDNGCLKPVEQLKTIGRGCSRTYLANELYKKYFL